MSQLTEAIRRIVAGQIKPAFVTGKVKSFDSSNYTITVDLNSGIDIEEVRIRSVINDQESGIFVEPVVGSFVLLGLIDNKIESLFVVGYSEVKSYKLNAELIHLNGDANGGLVKSAKVNSEINALKQELNTLKTIFSTWIPVVNDGGAALKTAVATWAGQQLNPGQAGDYENDKVKHG